MQRAGGPVGPGHGVLQQRGGVLERAYPVARLVLWGRGTRCARAPRNPVCARRASTSPGQRGMNGPRLGSVARAYCTSRRPRALRAWRMASKYDPRLMWARIKAPPGLSTRCVSRSSVTRSAGGRFSRRKTQVAASMEASGRSIVPCRGGTMRGGGGGPGRSWPPAAPAPRSAAPPRSLRRWPPGTAPCRGGGQAPSPLARPPRPGAGRGQGSPAPPRTPRRWACCTWGRRIRACW